MCEEFKGRIACEAIHSIETCLLVGRKRLQFFPSSCVEAPSVRNKGAHRTVSHHVITASDGPLAKAQKSVSGNTASVYIAGH